MLLFSMCFEVSAAPPLASSASGRALEFALAATSVSLAAAHALALPTAARGRVALLASAASPLPFDDGLLDLDLADEVVCN